MANYVDMNVGRKIRHLRRKNRLTVEELARRVLLPSAQIMRFESGEERVTAQFMWRIAGTFRLPIATFYEQDDKLDPEMQAAIDALADMLMDREVVRIVRSYSTLTQTQRHALFEGAKKQKS